ncbi:MAG: hypothetical protein M3Y59_14450 [Myxococcota bacterium]|nr:hypothetical protein [Myxococcota bacterium]
MRGLLRQLLPAVALALTVVTGCRCEEWIPISDDQGTFRAEPGEIDFGRVLEGSRVSATVRLVSASRFAQTVRVTTSPPFFAPPSVELPAGGQVSFELTFMAGDVQVEDRLVLLGDAAAQAVQVRGTGVRPLDCRTAVPCRNSTYDLETDRCVEMVVSDDLPCESDNLCLENTTCRAGACVGDLRSCDDFNLCTTDGTCSPQLGCVHRPVRCPAPGRACEVAVCDSEVGCGFAPAPDFSACGNFTCQQGAFCIAGACAQVPTPEGFPCAPPSPCQGEGTCQAQVCVRPDAGELSPSFSLAVPSGPGPAAGGDPLLVAVEGNLFTELCSEDAGCALASWTFNGFERFLAPHPDGRTRRVLGGTATGVWVSAGDAVELYSPDTGALLASHPMEEPGPGGFAISTGGALWLSLPGAGHGGDGGDGGDGGPADGGEADGGLPERPWLRLLPPDGGTGQDFVLEDTWQPPQLVLDGEDGLYLAVTGGFVSRVTPDAGSLWTDWKLDVTTGGGVAVGLGRLLVGGALLLQSDGGGQALLSDAGAAGEPVHPQGEFVLLTRTASFSLYRSCTTPFVEPCAQEEQGLWVRSFVAEDAGVLWRAEVIPAQTPGSVAQWVNVDGGVALLTQRAPDGGTPQLLLQGFFEGNEYLHCPLEGGGQLGAAVFDGPALYLLRSRDGGWSLDAYDFTGAPLDYSGWGARGAVGGTRRSAP